MSVVIARRKTLSQEQQPNAAFQSQWTKTGQTTVYGGMPGSEPGHLCDDEHPQESNRDFRAGLNNMQEGYGTAAPTSGSYVPYSAHNSGAARAMALSPEQRRTEQKELKELLAAGIISQDEYNDRMRRL